MLELHPTFGYTLLGVCKIYLMGNIKVEGVIFGTKKKIFGLEFVWWGQSQWYKWRWNETHIDMGWISIYGLPNKGVGKYFWKLIAVCCKPMRIMYHRRFVPKSKKLEDVIKDLSHFR